MRLPPHSPPRCTSRPPRVTCRLLEVLPWACSTLSPTASFAPGCGARRRTGRQAQADLRLPAIRNHEKIARSRRDLPWQSMPYTAFGKTTSAPSPSSWAYALLANNCSPDHGARAAPNTCVITGELTRLQNHIYPSASSCRTHAALSGTNADVAAFRERRRSSTSSEALTARAHDVLYYMRFGGLPRRPTPRLAAEGRRAGRRSLPALPRRIREPARQQRDTHGTHPGATVCCSKRALPSMPASPARCLRHGVNLRSPQGRSIRHPSIASPQPRPARRPRRRASTTASMIPPAGDARVHQDSSRPMRTTSPKARSSIPDQDPRDSVPSQGARPTCSRIRSPQGRAHGFYLISDGSPRPIPLSRASAQPDPTSPFWRTCASARTSQTCYLSLTVWIS